jgi:DNA-directed RNA polymerase subunit omega
MARVTVEDCMKVVENRFELVVIAAQRAKDICSGAKLTIERDNDKNAVISLREIAQENVSSSSLREIVVRNLQKRRSKFDLNEDSTTDDISAINEEEIEMEFREDMGSVTGVKDFNSKNYEAGFEELSTEEIDNNAGFSFEDGDIESED